MHTAARRMSVAIVATLVFFVANGVSSASRGIGLENGGRPITLSSERVAFEAGGVRITCPITLGGTLGRGFQKAEGIAVGEITSATLPGESCTGGTVRLLTETFPWLFRYFSFSGTLPIIAGLELGITSMAALANVFGLSCLYQGTPRGTATGSGTVITEFRVNSTVRIPLFRGESIFCPSQATLSGTLRVSPTVRMSLLESILGATVSSTPTTLTIPAGNPTGTLTLTVSGGTARIVAIATDPAVGEPPFSAMGCLGTTLTALSPTCMMTITPGGRPTRGRIQITYVNEMNVRESVISMLVVN